MYIIHLFFFSIYYFNKNSSWFFFCYIWKLNIILHSESVTCSSFKLTNSLLIIIAVVLEETLHEILIRYFLCSFSGSVLKNLPTKDPEPTAWRYALNSSLEIAPSLCLSVICMYVVSSFLISSSNFDLFSLYVFVNLSINDSFV